MSSIWECYEMFLIIYNKRSYDVLRGAGGLLFVVVKCNVPSAAWPFPHCPVCECCLWVVMNGIAAGNQWRGVRMSQQKRLIKKFWLSYSSQQVAGELSLESITMYISCWTGNTSLSQRERLGRRRKRKMWERVKEDEGRRMGSAGGGGNRRKSCSEE